MKEARAGIRLVALLANIAPKLVMLLNTLRIISLDIQKVVRGETQGPIHCTFFQLYQCQKLLVHINWWCQIDFERDLYRKSEEHSKKQFM